MRRVVPVLLALMISLATTGCGGGLFNRSDSDGKPFRIGHIASLNGNYAALGSEQKKSVELAVEEINAAGGVLGHPLQVVLRDDRSLPDQSVAAFVEAKGAVDAFIGSPFSNSALATIPLAEQEKVPYLSLAPADEQVNPVRSYAFVVPAISSTYAERLLQYFQATNVTKVAVAYDTRSSYAVAGFKGMRAKAGEYGVTLVASEEFQTTTTDFGPVLSRVKSSGAQALAVWATGGPAVAVTKQYAAAKTGMPLVLTGAQASRLFLDAAGPAAEGVFVASSIGVVGGYLPEGAQRESINRLSRSFRGLYRYAPPQFAQDGYSAVQLLAAAIKKAKSIDRAKVRAALETIELVTPNGRYSYSKTDHSGLSTKFISINRVNGGALIPTDWARTELSGLTGR